MRVKFKRMVEIEHDARYLVIIIPVDDDDMPANYPGRDDDEWRAVVDVDSGILMTETFCPWPSGYALDLQAKPRDSGTYKVLAENGELIAQVEQEYVPGWIPGDYGDYICLNIGDDGKVANWCPETFKRELESEPHQ